MTIRVASTTDADAVTAICAPIVAGTSISVELTRPSVDQMRTRIVKTHHELPRLVSEDAQGKVNGYVYASKHRGIFRKVGFKLDARHDVGWCQKELRGPSDPVYPSPCERGGVR
jgi:L-amino acid N-acyltransferase YncA